MTQDTNDFAHDNKTLQINSEAKPAREFLATILFAYFLGNLGIHRFYTGYTAIGVFQLLTYGGFGIWMLIDLIAIATNNYKDADGRELYKYNRFIGITFLVLPGIIFALVFIGIIMLIKTSAYCGHCHA